MQHNPQFRVISNGHVFRVQQSFRRWWQRLVWWPTLERWATLRIGGLKDGDYFSTWEGTPYEFKTENEAQAMIMSIIADRQRAKLPFTVYDRSAPGE